jgi:hypothetical protein
MERVRSDELCGQINDLKLRLREMEEHINCLMRDVDNEKYHNSRLVQDIEGL